MSAEKLPPITACEDCGARSINRRAWAVGSRDSDVLALRVVYRCEVCWWMSFRDEVSSEAKTIRAARGQRGL